MTKHFLPFLLCLFFTVLLTIKKGYAQQKPFSTELKFAEYLADKKLFAEAVYVMNKQLNDSSFSRLPVNQRDSLYYQLGWVQYKDKKLQESSSALLKVSSTSPFYLKSRYFAAYNLTYLEKTDSATRIYCNIPDSNSVLYELKQFQLAGIALLKRDYKSFTGLQQSFTYKSYAVAGEEKKLGEIYSKLSAYHPKSPWVAGALSAVIPGLGKIYAGKVKQGIGAFLPIASLGLLTYEAFNKGGIKSARFIGYGSVFLIFYTANIWGSAVSVKVNAQEFYKQYDNKILFNMHIPLRNIFN